MIRLSKTALSAIAAASILAFPASVLADEASDKAEILGIWDSYSEARVSGDVDTWLSLWDKEGKRLVPGKPAVDYATFAPATPARFAKPPASMEINSEEVVITGDYAYSRGTFIVNDAVEGNFLTVFRRQDDGSWGIYRDAMNFITE